MEKDATPLGVYRDPQNCPARTDSRAPHSDYNHDKKSPRAFHC
jgi:hypothetical protein